MEIATDEGGEEEEDGDFNPVEENDSDDDEEDEEEYEEDEEEVEEEKPKSSPKKKAQTPKGKAEKSPAASPQKVIKKTEDADSEAQEKTESPLKKKKKKKKQQVKQDEETKEGELPLKNLKTNNKENIVQQKEKPAKKAQTPAKPKKIKLQTGTTIEDLKVGEGKLAKPGKKVFMYYRGVLANNQKEFDSQLSGKPFMFGLGKGEVIQGWDAGIIGMKVGGKRRLTVPPSQGYGSQRTGPIPPNSTLIFDVELKSVR
ncbi:peptidyl-prolyl cis-trans isomerase FKBP15-3 isoform X2 [Strongylocentrotus purpuratus]|uniref:peptidylprolyl isomerase n=1 Tax=Strongylocentrotus purpuratus TaxID=7668 RepID=A0A7M7SUE5_STRPU|nr:peptidyl-prolyl cis-trans isomerase FKBP15-3 isoform X2 [Strongylocentrotus purpuratus]